jgi:hypothetical protein
MTKIAIVLANKSGEIENINVKAIDDELYKKCGFKTPTEFQRQSEYAVNIDGALHVIRVYGKKKGKSNMINKYEFPPPIDKVLFYGSCAIVCHRFDFNTEEFVPISMTCKTWESIYIHLMGGEIKTTHEEDDEEEADVIAEEKMEKEKGNLTKDGYLKDGFIDDDDEPKQKKPKKEKNLEKEKEKKKKPLRKKPIPTSEPEQPTLPRTSEAELTFEEY